MVQVTKHDNPGEKPHCFMAGNMSSSQDDAKKPDLVVESETIRRPLLST
jgi:hypothetical protein